MNDIIKTERGWAGHFCCASHCSFRRNTLLEYKGTKIVVSTVGALVLPHARNSFEPTDSCGNYYETMAFYAKDDDIYDDANVSKQVSIDSPCRLQELDDIKANEMHENVVIEISNKLVTDCLSNYID